MAKRKRVTVEHNTVKKQKLDGTRKPDTISQCFQQPLLEYCHRRVQNLKDYLLAALPTTSRVRRKRLLSLTESPDHVHFFSTTLVGVRDGSRPATIKRRLDEFSSFTQAFKSGHCPSATAQQWTIGEIIDFVTWSLFRECAVAEKRPNHILCHGLDRFTERPAPELADCRPVLSGVVQRYPNPSRDELLKPVWRELIAHLGRDALSILITLLMDHNVFVKPEHGTANLRQLSGYPIHDLIQRKSRSTKAPTTVQHLLRTPSEIKFARNRILYGKPCLNHRGVISFGFQSIHVLNRLSKNKDDAAESILARYIFPRQCKLHNVFTSITDRRETTQVFKDYMVRDDEIPHMDAKLRAHLPRRLRGETIRLVERIKVLHDRCPYHQLLYHYCPVSMSPVSAVALRPAHQKSSCRQLLSCRTQLLNITLEKSSAESTGPDQDDNESSFLPYTVSDDQVSAFCRTVLTRILPAQFLGAGDVGARNWGTLLHYVDRFVTMRRFESFSLHEVCQGIRVNKLEWLVPTTVLTSQRPSISDSRKREEILHEFVYYIFDSLLIPLLNSNFYVTESSVHRNQLLYFRHDVWARLCQPSLTTLQLGALVHIEKLDSCYDKHPVNLGYSNVRFLPKDIGIRPIANLRRRVVDANKGSRILGPSINSQLAPVFEVLNYEKRDECGVFRSDSFSVQSLEKRLAEFKLRASTLLGQPLYFVKVDIQSAFDSIPQKKLLNIVTQIFKNDQYYITKHAVSKSQKIASNSSHGRSAFRFVRSAHPLLGLRSDEDIHDIILSNKKDVITSNIDWREIISSAQAKQILEEHILNNIVKLGRKYYKKSEGIAQGSVLSSLLCTFFYNHFEMSTLGFLDAQKSIILRVMDDFLLISFDEADALRFVTAMKAGDSTYGIHVSAEKSLVNFDVTIDGVQVPRLIESSSFPFCGLFIDTRSLQISKNRVRKDNLISNSLTVDLHGQSGVKFKRRVIASLRIQLQSIVLNQTLNDDARIAQTLTESIQETAMKMHQYYVNMPVRKRPDPSLLIEVVRQLMSLSVRLISENRGNSGTWTRSRIQCIVAAGILKVLSIKNSQYAILLCWLRQVRSSLVRSLEMDEEDLGQLVDQCFRSVQHYSF